MIIQNLRLRRGVVSLVLLLQGSVDTMYTIVNTWDVLVAILLLLSMTEVRLQVLLPIEARIHMHLYRSAMSVSFVFTYVTPRGMMHDPKHPHTYETI
jgi:hypothetical protein